MDKEKLMSAIRALREHADLTQDEFAKQVFGKTLPTQQRYERLRPPTGAALTVLVQFARQHGRPDLAELFKCAAIESAHPDIRKLIQEPAAVSRSKRA